jgi:hypothetical protein
VGTVFTEWVCNLPGHLYQAANIASEAEMLAMTPGQLKAANIPMVARRYLSEVRAFGSHVGVHHVGVHGLLIKHFFCVWTRPGRFCSPRELALACLHVR